MTFAVTGRTFPIMQFESAMEFANAASKHQDRRIYIDIIIGRMGDFVYRVTQLQGPTCIYATLRKRN